MRLLHVFLNWYAKCILRFLLFVFYLAMITPLAASVPIEINYQGRLIDGTNLVNGVREITICLFDSSLAGTQLFAETQNVAVVDGLYALSIGSLSPVGTLQAALTNTDVYIEILIDGLVLTPREKVSSVPYALIADRVSAGAITRQMLAPGVGSDTQNLAFVGTTLSIQNGNEVNLNSLDQSADISLKVTRSGDTMTGPLFLPVGGLLVGTHQFSVTTNGFIGIGVRNPTVPFDVRKSTMLLYHPTNLFGIGSTLKFGDQEYVYLREDQDDKLTIHAKHRIALMGDSSFGVGIGTENPSSPLTVAGMIESTSGGVRFPDGSTQTTAYIAPLPPSLHTNVLVFHQVDFQGADVISSRMGSHSKIRTADGYSFGYVPVVLPENATIREINGYVMQNASNQLAVRLGYTDFPANSEPYYAGNVALAVITNKTNITQYFSVTGLNHTVVNAFRNYWIEVALFHSVTEGNLIQRIVRASLVYTVEE